SLVYNFKTSKSINRKSKNNATTLSIVWKSTAGQNSKNGKIKKVNNKHGSNAKIWRNNYRPLPRPEKGGQSVDLKTPEEP
ncbi:hypothetical protein CCACVL1_31066, partial [Corchorus capsularis]